jgi:hypothetical protein
LGGILAKLDFEKAYGKVNVDFKFCVARVLRKGTSTAFYNFFFR